MNISGSGYLDQVCSGRKAIGGLVDRFNYNCFNHPQTSTLGNMDPNQLFGPSLLRFDGSIFRTFSLNERFSLEFRTEVFNIFNTPMFNTPAGTSIAYKKDPNTGVLMNNVVDPTGTSVPPGQINAMNANWNQREIQFGLKLLF